ncbi:hypothetical protein XH99_31855 [Bradyrhizobium nanningense]|uniref:Uncharacterized protein n=1 Tax=Bradyrhizobium nanningense TaxID=1325118 RepID=A0A4Q0RW30_9BRAD|nr:hypothetical protein [Bradyrhizobium nanningense]RXH23309.1 hypothetical protein XH99_31855 [Bradyrhizobium nanningense]RXH27590.1 hypothetical protein XH84_29780 [Bradyrhizobium nanningense]
MARSVSALLEEQFTRVAAKNTAASKQSAALIKHALAIHDSLGSVRGPIKKRAESEQRNDRWFDAELKSAYSAKVQELGHLRLNVEKLASALKASKPALPAFDRSDVLSAMETIAIAQRVASTDPTKLHTLTPAERMAALRVPTLAKLPESIVNEWTSKFIRDADPQRMETYETDADAVRAAEDALTIVKRSLQHEAGFIDPKTGVPTPFWDNFERDSLAPLNAEIESHRVEQERQSAMASVAAAREALRQAEESEHQAIIKQLKSL